MNKAKMIAELENMVVTRLFGRQPWLASLGKELDVELFNVFLGMTEEWEVPMILEQYRLIDESEADAFYSMEKAADASAVLSGYVKRAYFVYRKANKFLH